MLLPEATACQIKSLELDVGPPPLMWFVIGTDSFPKTIQAIVTVLGCSPELSD